MGKSYYTLYGWKGLSGKGKFHAFMIFLIAGGLCFFGFKYFYYNQVDLDLNFIDNLFSYIAAIVGGYLIMWFSMAFLEKNTYVRTEYFCADCNQFLGYSPTSCDRCGSNRYTEEGGGDVGRTVRNR